MPSALLLYNPHSGRNHARNMLDTALELYQTAGWTLDIKRSNYAGDIPHHFDTQELSGYDAFIAVGGDGTLNEVVNGMLRHGLDKPLGIVSCGTVNDFARYLALPTDPRQCFSLFLQNHTERVDVGNTNGRYFINVCAVGMFSHGYMTYDPELKRIWGKAAYYVIGATDSMKFKPSVLRLTADDEVFEEKFQLVLVLNGTGTGGFPNISRQSTACDGVFDLVAVKATPGTAIPSLFFKILNGDVTVDRNVIYRQIKTLTIESLDDSPFFHACDIDGDRGPTVPLEIAVKPAALTVYSGRLL